MLSMSPMNNNEDGSNGSYLSVPVENRQENGPGEIYKDGEKRP